MIDFSSARNIAINLAKEYLRELPLLSKCDIIDEYYISEEKFWIFFRSGSFHPPNNSKIIFSDGAFAVSRNGESLVVRDYRFDSLKLNSQIEKLRLHFYRIII